MNDIDNQKTYATYHDEFYKIAIKNNFEILNLSDKYFDLKDDFNKKVDTEYEEPMDLFIELLEVVQIINRHSMEVVIFCALTLEAYINYYGINNFSRNYFDSYLDNLNTKQKWIIIPQLKNSKSIDPGRKPYALLKELFSKRNDLVHFKAKTYKPADLTFIDDLNRKDKIAFYKDIINRDHIENTKNDSKKAIDTVRQILIELKKIDSEVDINWIKEVEPPPITS